MSSKSPSNLDRSSSLVAEVALQLSPHPTPFIRKYAFTFNLQPDKLPTCSIVSCSAAHRSLTDFFAKVDSFCR
jgi:hypothetical protein